VTLLAINAGINTGGLRKGLNTFLAKEPLIEIPGIGALLRHHVVCWLSLPEKRVRARLVPVGFTHDLKIQMFNRH